MSLDELQNGLSNISTGEIVAGTLGAVAGAIVGAGAVAISKRKKSSKRKRSKSRSRITHTKRGWKQDRKRFNKSQKWEVYYRKHKKKHKMKSKKGIHYTKKGQPYIIKSDGKARFIKKSNRRYK